MFPPMDSMERMLLIEVVEMAETKDIRLSSKSLSSSSEPDEHRSTGTAVESLSYVSKKRSSSSLAMRASQFMVKVRRFMVGHCIVVVVCFAI